MFVRIGSHLMLAVLLGLVSVGQAKPFAKIDSLAKRLLHRTVSVKNAFLNSKQAIVGAVGIAALSCGNIACEKIQQPMVDGFTRSGDPSVGFNVNSYNSWMGIGGSYHAENVDNPENSGIIGGNITIPINLHSRLASFGDFRLSIGDGYYRNSIYGVIDSSSGSFTITDAHGGGNSIGNGVHNSDHTLLTLNVDSNVTIEAKIYHPQIDTANDSIGRNIELNIRDNESNEVITYNASTTWEFTLTSDLVSSPPSLLMPSYQQIASALGKSNFIAQLEQIGLSAAVAVHDSLDTNIYTAEGLSGRKRLKRSGGLTQYWDEGSFSGVSARLTVRGNTANVSLSKGHSSHVSDIPVGGSVTLGSGFDTHEWTLQLGELKILNGSFYRSMSLSAVATSEFRPFNFIGIHVGQSSQYYIDVAQLGWDLDGSLTASGW